MVKDPGLDKYYLAIAFEQVRDLPETSEGLKLNLIKPVDIHVMKRMFIEKALKLLDDAKKNKKSS